VGCQIFSVPLILAKEVIMKKIGIVLLLLVLSTFTSFFIAPASGAPQKYILDPYLTWNADMVNREQVTETGDGVYIAVLDTGLAPNWRDFFPRENIATKLGKGFFQPIHVNPKTLELVCRDTIVEASWVGSLEDTHGTMVASVILGFNYNAPTDDLELTFFESYPLPPLFVEGMAPDATIIPVKVLKTYHLPPLTGPGTDYPYGLTTGTDSAIAAGIYYATELKLQGYTPMIISMSLGGPEPETTILEEAIDYAIDNGVIVVASAGNEGVSGMGWPGAYSQVISVGACGWQYEWLHPTDPILYRLWWLQNTQYGYREVEDPTNVDEIYITYWSSRELAGQELDVVAPGSWVRGPFTWSQGYNHIPWWAKGEPPWTHWEGIPKSKNFFYIGGTSFSAPTVSAIAALMLEKDPELSQGEIESILKTTAIPIPSGSMTVFDLYDWSQGWHTFYPDFYTYTWGDNATGAGLVDAYEALEAIP
jgi:subtilisin family serine protease